MRTFKLKPYKLVLDQSNTQVLIKKLNNQKMTRAETKKLYRTITVIEKAHNNIQINIKNEKKVDDIFF